MSTEEFVSRCYSAGSDYIYIKEDTSFFNLQSVTTEAVSDEQKEVTACSEQSELQSTEDLARKLYLGLKKLATNVLAMLPKEATLISKETAEAAVKALGISLWEDQKQELIELVCYAWVNQLELRAELQSPRTFLDPWDTPVLHKFSALFAKAVTWPNIKEFVPGVRAPCCKGYHYSECVNDCRELKETLAFYFHQQ